MHNTVSLDKLHIVLIEPGNKFMMELNLAYVMPALE